MGWLAESLRTWPARFDLREHEDKILLLLAFIVSALVGLTIVAFVAVTERLGKVLLASGGAARLLSPLIGSLVGGWLLLRFFPDARGSGIPQTRVALLLQKGFISLRSVVGKFICSSISLGSGVALGREGPSVHIGAGIASVAGRRLGLREEQVKSLIPVGTAAAVAAAFNTPLAAVLFTLEEILADLHARLVGTVVIGATTSWMILRLLLGDEPLFHVPAYQLVHPLEFIVYAALGTLGGLISVVFVRSLLWQRAMFSRVPARWKAVTPGAGGLTVGLLALVAPGVLGVGYNLVGDALNSQLALKVMLLMLALKIVATSTCYGSGNAGGIFGPSLFMGAMLGGSVGHVAHSLMPDHTATAGAYALVGMGAAFAGIVRTPMTSVIMIFEVTRDYTIIVPLMIANMCSYLLSRKLQKLPIYEALSRQDGIMMPSAEHLPQVLVVEDAMQPLETELCGETVAEPFVHPDDPLDTALQRMGQAGVAELPVLARAGARSIGIVGKADILEAYERLPRQRQQKDEHAFVSQNWLPPLAAILVATVFLGSGLLFWQRGRRTELGREAYAEAQRLLRGGKTDEAILSLRNALAYLPQDSGLRTALGVALVRQARYEEAARYLNAALHSDPHSGLAQMGSAEIALSRGDKGLAAQLFQQSLAGDWPEALVAERRATQMKYAALLADVGRRREAVRLLLAIIEQRGDDPAGSKQAAELVRHIGSPEQAEEAQAELAAHFPADAEVWLRLGDARFRMNQESKALEAYRRAAQLDQLNPAVQDAIALVETSLRLDPTLRRLSERERAVRADSLIKRVHATVALCKQQQPDAIQDQKPSALARLPRGTASDQLEAAARAWKLMPAVCRSDTVLAHVFAKLAD